MNKWNKMNKIGWNARRILSIFMAAILPCFLLPVDSAAHTIQGRAAAGLEAAGGDLYEGPLHRSIRQNGRTATTYTVVFDANIDGKETIVKTSQVEEGGSIHSIVVPRSGWNLTGWYTDKGYTSKWDFNSTVTEDLHLYAKWQEMEQEEPIILNGSPLDSETQQRLNNLGPGKTVTICTESDTEISSITFKNGIVNHLIFTGPGHLTITGDISLGNADGSTITLKDGANITANGNLSVGSSGSANGKLTVTGDSTLDLGDYTPRNFDHLEINGGGKLSGESILRLLSPLELSGSFTLEINSSPILTLSNPGGYSNLTDLEKEAFANSILSSLPDGCCVGEWQSPEDNLQYYTILDCETQKPANNIQLRDWITPTLELCPSQTSLEGGGPVTLELKGTDLPPDAVVTLTCDDSSIPLTAGDGHTWTATLPNQTKTYTFTASYAGNKTTHRKASSDPCTITVTHQPLDIQDAEVTLDADGCVYDGTAQTPAATVALDGQPLKEEADYTIAYRQNINAGNAAEAIITGIGGYRGEKKAVFTIKLATPVIQWEENTQQTAQYNGSPANISILPSVTLANGEQFSGTILYSYCADGAGNFTDGLPAQPGSYNIKAHIAAQGNYSAAESTNTLRLTIKNDDSGGSSSGGNGSSGPSTGGNPSGGNSSGGNGSSGNPGGNPSGGNSSGSPSGGNSSGSSSGGSSSGSSSGGNSSSGNANGSCGSSTGNCPGSQLPACQRKFETVQHFVGVTIVTVAETGPNCHLVRTTQTRTETISPSAIKVTETVWIPEGTSITETLTETLADGTIVQTETATAIDGQTVITVTISYPDGCILKTVTKTAVNSKGKKQTVTTATKINADDTISSITETILIKGIQANTDATITITRNGAGKTIQATADLQTILPEGPVPTRISLTQSATSQILEATGGTDAGITLAVTSHTGQTKKCLKVNTKDLTPGNGLFLYKINEKTGKHQLVEGSNGTSKKDTADVAVSKNGNLSVPLKREGVYECVSKKKHKQLTEEILNTISLAKPSAAIYRINKKETAKLAIPFSSGMDMSNVQSITYQSSDPGSFAVKKLGIKKVRITAKKSGAFQIKATVKLKNGKTKTLYYKVTVKN